MKLLKVIKAIMSFGVGVIIGACVTAYLFKDKVVKIYKGEINSEKNMSRKHLDLYMMSNQWVRVHQEGKSIADYLKKKGYRTIAIYGMSYAGDTLLEELKNSSIVVSYGIDKGADGIYSSINIVKPCDELEKVDAIIVTSISYFDEIVAELCVKIDCPIISLEDILYEI